MTNEIAPLQAVQDKIRDRIRADFVELMPDDLWGKMVESVVSTFTSPEKDSYGRETGKPSPLAQLITKEIEALAQQSVQQELSRLDANYWGQWGHKAANDAVMKMVTENMPDIMASIQNSMASMMVMNAVSAIRNSRQY